MTDDPNMQNAFGGAGRAPSSTPAPTGPEVAANPAAFAGKSNDPIEQGVPYQATRVYGAGEYSGPMVFADWYKAEAEPALLWLAQVLGAPLNLANLSESQRKRMGL